MLGKAVEVYQQMQCESCRGLPHLRSEPSQVGVLHKASRLWAKVILGKVWQGAPREAKGYPLALHILLPYAGNHLHSTASVSA